MMPHALRQRGRTDDPAPIYVCVMCVCDEYVCDECVCDECVLGLQRGTA